MLRLLVLHPQRHKEDTVSQTDPQRRVEVFEIRRCTECTSPMPHAILYADGIPLERGIWSIAMAYRKFLKYLDSGRIDNDQLNDLIIQANGLGLPKTHDRDRDHLSVISAREAAERALAIALDLDLDDRVSEPFYGNPDDELDDLVFGPDDDLWADEADAVTEAIQFGEESAPETETAKQPQQEGYHAKLCTECPLRVPHGYIHRPDGVKIEDSFFASAQAGYDALYKLQGAGLIGLEDAYRISETIRGFNLPATEAEAKKANESTILAILEQDMFQKGKDLPPMVQEMGLGILERGGVVTAEIVQRVRSRFAAYNATRDIGRRSSRDFDDIPDLDEFPISRL